MGNVLPDEILEHVFDIAENKDKIYLILKDDDILKEDEIEIQDILQKLQENLKNVLQTKDLEVCDIFVIIKKNMLKEFEDSISLLDNSPFLSHFGIEEFIEITYDLSPLSQSKKMLFNYALFGRRGNIGLLQQLNGRRIGRGVISVPKENMEQIERFINSWGITVAQVDRAKPADLNLRIIRMDGTTRKNAKATIGENVIVRAAQVTEADEVVLAMVSNGNVKITQSFLNRILNGRAVTKGDIVTIGGGNKMFSDIDFGDDIFRLMLEGFPNISIFGAGELRFMVVNTAPKGYVVITENTKISISKETAKEYEMREKHVSYEDIGGLSDAIAKIREMVELPLKHPEIFMRLGIEPPKGVLLYGPPGTGKTLLARAVADESEAHFILINGPEVMSKWVGDAEKKLRDLFEEAEKNAPSIIFIDEIDAIATKREESVGEVE